MLLRWRILINSITYQSIVLLSLFQQPINVELSMAAGELVKVTTISPGIGFQGLREPLSMVDLEKELRKSTLLGQQKETVLTLRGDLKGKTVEGLTKEDFKKGFYEEKQGTLTVDEVEEIRTQRFELHTEELQIKRRKMQLEGQYEIMRGAVVKALEKERKSKYDTLKQAYLEKLPKSLSKKNVDQIRENIEAAQKDLQFIRRNTGLRGKFRNFFNQYFNRQKWIDDQLRVSLYQIRINLGKRLVAEEELVALQLGKALDAGFHPTEAEMRLASKVSQEIRRAAAEGSAPLYDHSALERGHDGLYHRVFELTISKRRQNQVAELSELLEKEWKSKSFLRDTTRPQAIALGNPDIKLFKDAVESLETLGKKAGREELWTLQEVRYVEDLESALKKKKPIHAIRLTKAASMLGITEADIKSTDEVLRQRVKLKLSNPNSEELKLVESFSNRYDEYAKSLNTRLSRLYNNVVTEAAEKQVDLLRWASNEVKKLPNMETQTSKIFEQLRVTEGKLSPEEVELNHLVAEAPKHYPENSDMGILTEAYIARVRMVGGQTKVEVMRKLAQDNRELIERLAAKVPSQLRKDGLLRLLEPDHLSQSSNEFALKKFYDEVVFLMPHDDKAAEELSIRQREWTESHKNAQVPEPLENPNMARNRQIVKSLEKESVRETYWVERAVKATESYKSKRISFEQRFKLLLYSKLDPNPRPDELALEILRDSDKTKLWPDEEKLLHALEHKNLAWVSIDDPLVRSPIVTKTLLQQSSANKVAMYETKNLADKLRTNQLGTLTETELLILDKLYVEELQSIQRILRRADKLQVKNFQVGQFAEIYYMLRQARFRYFVKLKRNRV